MELINATLFIGTVIAGITQFIKLLSPKINGSITILIAVLVGVLVALTDKELGVIDISVAQGIMIAFGAVGVTGALQMVGNNSTNTVVNGKELGNK